jgi:hypothetical protein
MSNDVSEVRAASIIRAVSDLIALMMEAARTSESSVDIQLRTRQYIKQNSELHMLMYFEKLVKSVNILLVRRLVRR